MGSNANQERVKRVIMASPPTASVGGTASVWLAGIQNTTSNGYRPNQRAMKLVRTWISGNVTATGAGATVDAEFRDRGGSIINTVSLDRSVSGWQQDVDEDPTAAIQPSDASTPGWFSVKLVGTGTGTATNVVVGWEVEFL